MCRNFLSLCETIKTIECYYFEAVWSFEWQRYWILIYTAAHSIRSGSQLS